MPPARIQPDLRTNCRPESLALRAMIDILNHPSVLEIEPPNRVWPRLTAARREFTRDAPRLLNLRGDVLKIADHRAAETVRRLGHTIERQCLTTGVFLMTDSIDNRATLRQQPVTDLNPSHWNVFRSSQTHPESCRCSRCLKTPEIICNRHRRPSILRPLMNRRFERRTAPRTTRLTYQPTGLRRSRVHGGSCWDLLIRPGHVIGAFAHFAGRTRLYRARLANRTKSNLKTMQPEFARSA